MSKLPSALDTWTAEQIALGRRWVETWKLAGIDLERIGRQELRQLDTQRDPNALRPGGLYTAAAVPASDFRPGRATTLVHAGAPIVNEVLRAADELQSVCQQHGWRYCFIGGLAQLRWGEPRETVDADLTLLTGFGGERQFVQTLLAHFEGRISDAEAFALERRVLLLRSRAGVGLDVSLAGMPYEELVVQRSSLFDYTPQVTLRTCSAEDLVVLKGFAGRSQDWVDIERLIVRQTDKLDWDYIHQQLRPLAELKGEPEILDQLDRRRREFER